MLLAVMAGVTVAFAYFYNPETQHYFVSTFHAAEIRVRQGLGGHAKDRENGPDAVLTGEEDEEHADGKRTPQKGSDVYVDVEGNVPGTGTPSAERLLKTVSATTTTAPGGAATAGGEAVGAEEVGAEVVGAEHGSDIPPPELVMPWTVARYLVDLQVRRWPAWKWPSTKMPP